MAKETAAAGRVGKLCSLLTGSLDDAVLIAMTLLIREHWVFAVNNYFKSDKFLIAVQLLLWTQFNLEHLGNIADCQHNPQVRYIKVCDEKENTYISKQLKVRQRQVDLGLKRTTFWAASQHLHHMPITVALQPFEKHVLPLLHTI